MGLIEKVLDSRPKEENIYRFLSSFCQRVHQLEEGAKSEVGDEGSPLLTALKEASEGRKGDEK